MRRATAGAELDFVRGLVNGTLPLNTFAKTLGYDAVEAESGRVAITLDPTDAHLNPWGTVHGGLVERGNKVNIRRLDSPDAPRSLMMVDGLRTPPQGNGG